MPHWTIHLEYAKADTAGYPLASLDAFLEILSERNLSPAVQGGPDRYVARVSVEAATFDKAIRVAAARVTEAAVQAGMPAWPVVRAEVMTEDELDAELARPQLPTLVGTAEVAGMLGISRQRVNELRSVGRNVEPAFPQPVASLAAGPVWDAAAVTGFLRRWDRKPGRPRGAEAKQAG